MNPQLLFQILSIVILGIVGTLGAFGHAFKAVYDKNQTAEYKDVQDKEYTFNMYWKKNKFLMFFVFICVWVFSYYQSEWTSFEKLGNWRGLIMMGMGYMGDSVFPSLFEILPIIINKIKAKFGFDKKE